MFYLLRKSLKSKAHLWDGADTYCRLYSTGGLVKTKYQLFDETHEQPICTMCKNVATRMKSLHKFT